MQAVSTAPVHVSCGGVDRSNAFIPRRAPCSGVNRSIWHALHRASVCKECCAKQTSQKKKKSQTWTAPTPQEAQKLVVAHLMNSSLHYKSREEVRFIHTRDLFS